MLGDGFDLMHDGKIMLLHHKFIVIICTVLSKSVICNDFTKT